MVEASPEFHAYLMEHSTDPKDYLDEAEQYPSIWEWPEVHDFAQRHGLQTVKLDQGACGHNCVKPTTLLTDLEAMKDLDGLRANGAKEEMHGGEPRSSRQTSMWSAWAPGLVRAIQLAIMKLQDVASQMKKFSIEQWRQHVRQNHIPFRRDCRLCIEEMGQDLPHRRRRGVGGESVCVMAVDVAGLSSRVLTLGVAPRNEVCADSHGANPAGDCQKGVDPDGALHAGECQDPGGVPGSEDPRSSQAPWKF